MNIRIATFYDIELLLKHDKHICKNELQNLINIQRVYIIEYNSNFIGWLRYNLFWDNIPFLNMLYLLKEFRSKGYGKQLVCYWEKNMKKQGYNFVMTSTQVNETAQHFYQKLGYVAVGGFALKGEVYEMLFQKDL